VRDFPAAKLLANNLELQWMKAGEFPSVRQAAIRSDHSDAKTAAASIAVNKSPVACTNPLA
jgi:hypothetical protein